MKLFVTISAFFFQACFVPACPAQQINIRTYNIEDGLVNNDVLNFYQDSQGFIWICTRGGLSRYDGSRFTNYTQGNGLTNDMINDISEIAPQEFIIAQNLEGPRLLKYGRIDPLPTPSDVIINRFYKTDSKRLLATADYVGLLEFKENRFIPINPAYKEGIGEMAMINDSIWVINYSDVYIQLMTPFLKPFSTRTYFLSTIIYQDSHHRTWIGTKAGLKLLSPVQDRNKSISFLSLPSAFDLPVLRENVIFSFLEDSKGNSWIGTSAGLVLIKPDGQSRIFTESDGLPASLINCVWEDHQNNIWIGTQLGLAKISLNNEVIIYTQKHGFSPEGAYSILTKDQNIIWLFDFLKISELNLHTGKFTNTFLKDHLKYLASKISPDETMIVNDNGCKIYKNGKVRGENINWPDTNFVCVVRADDEKFIGSIDSTIYHISHGAIDKLRLFLPDKIWILLVDKKGVLWAGTHHSGLYKIKMQNEGNKTSLRLIDSVRSQLPDQHIRSLYADKENELWVGTRYKGLVRLLEKGGGKYEMENYGAVQGLSSDFVRTIKRDTKGNIWVGTSQGLDKLLPTGNQYSIFNFGKVNKIFTQVYDICFLKDDYLIAGGYPYLVHARDMQQDTLPATAVYVTKVYSSPADSSLQDDHRQKRLPYNKAQINFEFSSPQFINEDFTQYNYRLLGSDDTNWTLSGKSHSVYFASLQPGNYTFEVRALGFNGNWGKPAAYAFIVSTPFWQRAWFVALIIFTTALLVYMLYRYRVLQLLRLQKVRNRIAADLHDEIGSNLTNISILSNLSKKNLSQPELANIFLQRISEEVSSSSQSLDDIIWSVNSNHDTLEETVARMRRYAAELFDAADISYDLHLDAVFEEKKLIMEQRRDLYLLYKEAVNNTFKHAEAKQVNIKISIKHNLLVLYIRDDGKGFETKKQFHRHGLEGMKERVKRWKGQIQIESAENKGTSLTIQMPVAG